MCRLAIILILCLFAPSSVIAQTAKEAVSAMKILQARIDQGTTFRDYVSAAGTMRYQVNEYLESDVAKMNPEQTEVISNALKAYELLGTGWNERLHGGVFGGMKLTPDAADPFVVRVLNEYPEIREEDIYYDRNDVRPRVVMDILIGSIAKIAKRELEKAKNMVK